MKWRFTPDRSRSSDRHDVDADHHFERHTDFCTRCGAHRSSVWLAEWPSHCPAGANVVGISHLLALRHIGEARAHLRPLRADRSTAEI